MSSVENMFERQARLQVESFGLEAPWRMTGQTRRNYVLAMTYALQDELHEATREVSWKPWAKDDFINEEAFLGELVDAWHFLMNLALIVDPTGARFVDAYFKKAEVNDRRQRAGYTHDYMKCVTCGRAMDEPGQDGVCGYCA